MSDYRQTGRLSADTDCRLIIGASLIMTDTLYLHTWTKINWKQVLSEHIKCLLFKSSDLHRMFHVPESSVEQHAHPFICCIVLLTATKDTQLAKCTPVWGYMGNYLLIMFIFKEDFSIQEISSGILSRPGLHCKEVKLKDAKKDLVQVNRQTNILANGNLALADILRCPW